MKGSLSHELDVDVPAAELWEFYGTIKLADLIMELLPHIISKVDILEGNGGLGTVMRIKSPSGPRGPRYQVERFVKVDEEKRVREVEIIEGGFLDLGLLSCFIGHEIIEKKAGVSSTIKSTIEYEVDEEHASNASLVKIAPMVAIGEAVAKYLIEKKQLNS